MAWWVALMSALVPTSLPPLWFTSTINHSCATSPPSSRAFIVMRIPIHAPVVITRLRHSLSASTTKSSAHVQSPCEVTDTAMKRTRGTSWRGYSHGSGKSAYAAEKEHPTNIGYKDNVSMHVRRLVDDSKSRSVAEILSCGSQRTQVNYYCLLKKMIGTLVEEMLTNWNMAKVAIMDTRANMAHLDGVLVALEASLTGRRYSMFPHTAPPVSYGLAGPVAGAGEALIVHTEGAAIVVAAQATGSSLHDSKGITAYDGVVPARNHKSGPNSPAAAVVVQGASPPGISFPIPSTIEVLQYKRTRKVDEEMVLPRKVEPLSIKLPEQQWEDDFFGPCPISEDNHDSKNAEASS